MVVSEFRACVRKANRCLLRTTFGNGGQVKISKAQALHLVRNKQSVEWLAQVSFSQGTLYIG